MLIRIFVFVVALTLLAAAGGWVAVTLSKYAIAYVHGIELSITDQGR